MSWLDQYGLNIVPAEVAAEPEWAASVLGSASAAELAQAQAELDMWSTMAFNGEDPFGANQEGPVGKEAGGGLAGLAGLPWGEEDSEGQPALGMFAHLAHSAPPTTSAFRHSTFSTVSPPETHSAPRSAAASRPPASRPPAARKRSLSQANLHGHAPPSPRPSENGSGSASGSGSGGEAEAEVDADKNGPLSEADKRRRNTEASARFRKKKREREAQLRQDTTTLAERVANLEKIADSVSLDLLYI